MPYASDIANDLLWTPFDNKSVNSHNLYERVSETEFLKECFSYPFFQNEKHSEEMISLFDDSPLTVEDIEYQMLQEKGKYKTFTDWLNMFENHKVYTLCGNSGTGKTTFLHHLKNSDTKYWWTILDVSSSPERFDWLGDVCTVVKKYERATRKTLAAILHEIHKIIFNQDSETDKIEKLYDKLDLIITNYISRFKKSYVAGCSLFNEMCSTFEKSVSKEEKLQAIAELFKGYFDNDGSEDDYQLLDKAMDVLILVLRCVDDSIDRRHIIVFDNFERFVTQDEIYNNEINEIRNRLSKYDLRINEKNNHYLKFKFIMAIRCSTARICGISLHPADELPSNIDISSWFDIEDILDRKTSLFQKYGINNSDYDLLKRLTGDLRKCTNGELTGLKLFLDPLFNDNKRLMVDFLGIVMENKENKEKFDYKTCLNKYKEIWDKNTSISRCAARNIVKGAILYKLRNIDDLFKNMMVIKENDESKETEAGLGLARRILTILYNRTSKSNEDVFLYDIVSELYSMDNVFEEWSSERFTSNRKCLSNIIFHMASYNRRDNDWIQFIDLQHSDMDKKLRICTPEEMEKILLEDFKEFKITIMPAGIAYLKHIVASFEYFSVRYSKKYLPLFATVPTLEEMSAKLDVTSLKCYNLINQVKDSAIRCINKIKDNNLKLIIKNGSLTHAERIISFHSFYINNFISYLKEIYINNDTVSPNVKSNCETLIEAIKVLKEEYVNAIRS